VQRRESHAAKSIESLLGDLRNDKQDRQTMGQIGVYFRN
jgi:hypothetical protein